MGCEKKQGGAPGVPVGAQAAVKEERPGFNGDFAVRRPDNPLDALRKAFDAGLRFDGGRDKKFLQQVLAEAGVDERSQVLVFSKTSMQNDAITHGRPRALYFSDDCYIGFVQGGMLEFAQADAGPGTVFYSIDFRDQPAEAPKWASPPRCMDCHEGAMTGERPGLVVRSVFTDKDGQPISSAGSFLVDHTTPLANRWGGWFVTGEHGGARHMGNVVALRLPNNDASLDREAGANLRSLAGVLDTQLYLRPTSDIVALMVLEHQVAMHNAYTQGSLLVREQVGRFHALMRETGHPEADLSPEIRSLIGRRADQIVALMLFANEAQLPNGGIGGDVGFQEAFRANRHPVNGRSLKDFQLLNRLFKYRCSYTVYSRAFAQMEPLLKAQVWARLQGALAGKNDLGAHLSVDEREKIAEILRETMP